MKNINLFVPYFRNEEILEQINECLDKGWTGLGYKTNEIESLWKEYTGLPNAHFLNSNTSGLHLAIKILKDANKWADDDEIITTPLTFVSSNHSIMYEGLKPVFAEIARNKQTTGLGHVTIADLKRLKIVIPPSTILDKWSAIVTPILDQAFIMDCRSKILSHLRDTLLPRLISGQLIPDKVGEMV